jgi:uncharacterized protein
MMVLSGCHKNKYPDPTDEFYVNDFAYALHPYTQKAIVNEGERLFEETKDIEEIGGLQMVFATFVVETTDDIASYDATEIFRQWEIGKNDMGVLVLMFFTEGIEDGISYLYLEETRLEVGYRMEQYLPAGIQGELLDSTIYGNQYDDLDMKVAHLLYELMKLSYEQVYSAYYDSFTYDLETFKESMDEYVYVEEDTGWLGMLLYWFSGRSSSWFLWVLIGFVVLGGGLKLRKNRGGGGSSGGYGIFRRH